MGIIYRVHEGNPRLQYYNNNIDYYTLNTPPPSNATWMQWCCIWGVIHMAVAIENPDEPQTGVLNPYERGLSLCATMKATHQDSQIGRASLCTTISCGSPSGSRWGRSAATCSCQADAWREGRAASIGSWWGWWWIDEWRTETHHMMILAAIECDWRHDGVVWGQG
jgi:hypothetical protein